MTLVVVWRAGEYHLMAVADTRIVRAPGNVLTEHGPKLLPISVVCKQPGSSGDFDTVVYRAEVGFAYSGSTLSALATHALSNTLLSKLIGLPAVNPPALSEIANFIAGASTDYMREVCQLTGNAGLFSAIVFGYCASEHRLRVFKLNPDLTGGQLQVRITEHNLSRIEIGGTASASAVIIGSSPQLLSQAIDADLADLKNRGETLPIVAYDAPRRALRKIISENADEAVGGIVQQASATPQGFQIISNVEPKEPTPHDPSNVGMFILGFNTHDIPTVGQYQVGAEGR